MPALYLIDGNSYFYRAFYAIKNLSASDGFPTNAIFGFTNILLELLNKEKPSHIGVAFDTHAPVERESKIGRAHV